MVKKFNLFVDLGRSLGCDSVIVRQGNRFPPPGFFAS